MPITAYAVSGMVDYSANTPLRQTILAHRDYWHQVRKVKNDIPKLRYVIINLHPATHDYLPSDYDGVVDRKNDIIFHDRTRYDENVAVLVSDFIRLAKTFIKLAEENGVSKEVIQKILEEETNAVYLATGKRWRFEDLLTIAVDIEYVVRFQRKNDSNTIANKTFDFSKTTIQQLIQDGYQETKEQLKEVIARLRELNREKKYLPS